MLMVLSVSEMSLICKPHSSPIRTPVNNAIRIPAVFRFKSINNSRRRRGGHVAACVRRLFFLPVPTHLEPSIDGDRIKYSPTSANVREKP